MKNDDVMWYEDYSDDCVFNDDKPIAWKECTNKMHIDEDSLNQTLAVIKNSSFAIFTAYRKKSSFGHVFSKHANIERNRKLKAFLNQHELGPHQLVGHYVETAKDGSRHHVVERSFLIEKPTYMKDEDFKSLVCGCLTIDGETQDGTLIHLKSLGNAFYFMDANGNMEKIGDKMTLGKISTMYSQHVKKLNVPFVFDGEECPDGVFGKHWYSIAEYAWAGHNGFGYEMFRNHFDNARQMMKCQK